MIQIDGSYGEGGGQILRTSLSLAALTGQPLEIANIRARRTKPGLQPQHLTAVRAAAALCDAELTGAAVGSSLLRFEPRSRPEAKPYRFDIGTAGATSLVAQTALLPLAVAGVQTRVTVTGGTHVPHSPPAEYLETVYLPALAAMGLAADFDYPRAGFFPKGGGEVHMDVEPAPTLSPVDFSERGKLLSLRAIVLTAGLPDHVGERGQAAVERAMKGIGRKVVVEQRRLDALNPGAAVFLVAECEGGRAGFSGLGERGKPMERVVEAPCDDFLHWWKTGAAVDEHLSDQLVLPAALARGESRWTAAAVTEHLRTVLWVVGRFLQVEHTLEEREEGTGLVTVRGSG